MARPLVVLQSFQEPRPTTNPYIAMLARSIAEVPGVELRTFTWRRALWGQIDVFHVHWPEVLLRGPSRIKTLRRQLLFLTLLARLMASRIAVVRTVHNLFPHDGAGRSERWLLAALDRLTTARIAINATHEPPKAAGEAVIPHGHYIDWFSAQESRDRIRGRVAAFGLLRPYKGVDRLIEAFRDASSVDPRLSLRIAGQPASEAFGAELRRLAVGAGDIELTLSYIGDAELVRLVAEAEVVAFPYREMYNSGGVLAALSLGRPVLVPDTAINDDLAAEVGAGWVRIFHGELTGQHLLDALAGLRATPPKGAPELAGRGWERAGAEHVALYRQAIGDRRARSRARVPSRGR